MKKTFLIVFIVLTVILAVSFLNLYSFLAPNKPESDASFLVVDAWVSDSSLTQAVELFKEGKYERILVPGTKMERSIFFPGIRGMDEAASVVLIYKGIPPNKIIPLYFEPVKKDRTFQSALTVKYWLKQHTHGNVSVNLFTESTHAQRSWLLYKKAFKDDYKVGIIASVPDDYDPEKWWKTSNGVRSVIDETIAYLYAFLFFHPDM
ncbi:MAG: DUF218 domain-containing protein [Bacteroidales bacterium]|nr:DUF218 domain-containing protein [Bacteroidales bacterium]